MSKTASPPIHITPTRLRILCLHGYTQNKQLFKQKTSFLKKDLKNIADLVYIDAPHLIPPPQTQDLIEEEIQDEVNIQRRWFRRELDSYELVGINESIEYIQHIWATEGPFDGILGFSQGAAVSALFLIHLQSTHKPLPFAIIISSPYRESNYTDKLVGRIKCTSLHVIGRNDSWVPSDRSVLMMGLFQDPEVSWHDGSHFVPAGVEQRKVFTQFIERVGMVGKKDDSKL